VVVVASSIQQLNIFNYPNCVDNNASMMCEIRWYPSPDTQLKLYCDAFVSLDKRKVVTRGVFKNQLGVVIFSYATNIGYYSVLHAELYVIYIGINIAWNRGFRKFWVKSDSKMAIKLLVNG